MEFVNMRSNKESRKEMLKAYAGHNTNDAINTIDTISEFIDCKRTKKVVVQIKEDKLPQFEKHLAKFFKKHGYSATIT